MPPHADALDIGEEQYLLRILKPKWTVLENDRERPTKEALTDTNYENSCFVEGEISADEIEQLFPGLKVARLPVQVVRESGFIIERRPDEAPNQCSNPRSHVVVGPSTEIRRLEYERLAKRVVKNERVTILG